MSPARMLRHSGRRLFAAVVAIVVIGMTAVAAVSANIARTDRAERQALLDDHARATAAVVERTITDAVQTLTTVRGLFRLDADPTNDAFVRFVNAAVAAGGQSGDATYNGFPAVGFIRHVRADEAADFVTRQRRAGLGDVFDDIPRDRDSYVLALHTQRDLDVLGNDVRPIPTRRRALDRARDSGSPAVTEWVVPITEQGVDPAGADQIALVYVPVYRAGEVPDVRAARRTSLIGWAAVAIRASTLFAQLPDGNARYAIALYDGPPTAQHLVRSTAGDVRADAPTALRTIDIGARSWTLVVSAAQPGTGVALNDPLAIFAAGSLLVLLTALLVHVLGRQRRRIEQRVIEITADLAASEQSLRRMADAVPVGIFDADLETGRTYYNHTFRELVHPAWTSWSEDYQDRLCGRIIASVRQGAVFSDRISGADAEGRTRWFEIRATGTRDEHGVVTRLLGSVADVTDDVTLETRLGEARDTALANARMKSEFLANMSHEIRTPLNGVLGLATLMLDDELAPAQRERLVTLREAGQHLLVLLNDILDFSKMEAGRLKLEEVPFSLAAVIDQVTTLHASTANDKGIELRHRIDDRIGPVTGDPARLRQVLQNLVGNALKFTDEGHVEVVADLRTEDDARRVIHVAVSDTGIGISREQQRTIFTAFTQADTSTTRLYGGSGLGLAICQQIIALMGGKLTVASEEGRGSTFSFTIALGVADRIVGLDEPAPEPMDTPVRSLQQRSDATVLLVEDNTINQQVAVGMLAKLGYTADVASDGLEALEALRGKRYDVVLMDCQMPRLDGFEATAHVRAMEGDARHTPIIAMTAAAMRGDRERCIAAGMDDYVSKPVTVEELGDAIGRALHRQGPARRAGAGDVPTAARPDDARPPLDLTVVASLHEMSAGDETLFERSRATFERTSAEDARAVHDAADDGDWALVGRLVHKVRGGAATIGSTTFVDACGALESAIVDHADDAALRVLLATFDAELERLLGALATCEVPAAAS